MAEDPFPQQRKPGCPVLRVRLFGRRKVGSVQPFHLYTLTLKPSEADTGARACFAERSAPRRCSYCGRVETDELSVSFSLSFCKKNVSARQSLEELSSPPSLSPAFLAPLAAAPSLCAHCFKHQSAPPRCPGHFRA